MPQSFHNLQGNRASVSPASDRQLLYEAIFPPKKACLDVYSVIAMSSSLNLPNVIVGIFRQYLKR